jgi:hypothetical protein
VAFVSQALTLGCYTQRCLRLAQLLAERCNELAAAAARARPQPGRAAAGAPAEGAAELMGELQQVVEALKDDMRTALEAREAELLQLDGAGGPRARPVADLPPPPEAAVRLAALRGRPPAALLACACALADRSVARLRSLLASGEAAAAAANAAVAQMPRELKERRALMPWTMSPADAALADDGGDGSGGGTPKRHDADALIRQRQQAHVRLHLEARRAARAAAQAQARLEELLARPELAPLRAEGGGGAAGVHGARRGPAQVVWARLALAGPEASTC